MVCGAAAEEGQNGGGRLRGTSPLPPSRRCPRASRRPALLRRVTWALRSHYPPSPPPASLRARPRGDGPGPPAPPGRGPVATATPLTRAIAATAAFCGSRAEAASLLPGPGRRPRGTKVEREGEAAAELP